MGKIEGLEKSTKDYISKVVQPMLQQICEDSIMKFDGGGTLENIHEDLWEKADIMISSDDFPDF